MNLVSETNRYTIDEDDWTERGTITTTGNTADLINLIFTLDATYGDDRPYAPIPDPNPNVDEWNSNSYAHGLLNALATDPDVTFSFNEGGADFPGWEKPIPLADFGI